ncbi:Zn-ribbon domain-containing OB-fold protein [Halobacteriales archaeon Cl-PHB]
MTWEPRPTPEVTPETAEYWAGAAEGRLLLRECRECGEVYFYPRSQCPACFGTDVVWTEASGQGTLYSMTVLESMSGWPEDALPLQLAFVTLAEGPKLLTNLVECDASRLSIGDPVSVRFVPTEDENVAIPVFTAEEEES